MLLMLPVLLPLWSLLAHILHVLRSSIAFTSGSVPLVVTIDRAAHSTFVNTSVMVFGPLSLITCICMWALSGVGVAAPGRVDFAFSLNTPLLNAPVAHPLSASHASPMAATTVRGDMFTDQLLLPLLIALLLHPHAEGSTMASACLEVTRCLVVLSASRPPGLRLFMRAIAGTSARIADMAAATSGKPGWTCTTGLVAAMMTAHGHRKIQDVGAVAAAAT
mmetsp:Transcript_70352/g.139505  ORF Transcript_70352/g.139505 Transcript_70352/m.139505 type:complete len:220 (+) Transcript_70352:1127-1786(+)